jgi:hypothetical protein
MKRQKGNEHETGHSKDNKKTTNRSMPCSFKVIPNPLVNLYVIYGWFLPAMYGDIGDGFSSGLTTLI